MNWLKNSRSTKCSSAKLRINYAPKEFFPKSDPYISQVEIDCTRLHMMHLDIMPKRFFTKIILMAIFSIIVLAGITNYLKQVSNSFFWPGVIFSFIVILNVLYDQNLQRNLQITKIHEEVKRLHILHREQKFKDAHTYVERNSEMLNFQYIIPWLRQIESGVYYLQPKILLDRL